MQSGGWGGGNQFLKALFNEFSKRKIISPAVDKADVVLFNGHQNRKSVINLKKAFSQKIFAHRVDGLYKLYNHPSDSRQDEVFKLNKNVADCTIFQTNWAKDEHVNFGLPIDKPHSVICNAPDKSIFNTDYSKSKSSKIRLICTSWSANKNKGFSFYQFLDEKLDFDKYSFSYIGNDPGINFKNINKVGPLNSKDLSEQLKSHDIFITASRYECCSNSLLEALSCGLPVAGLDSGGTPEIISKGGELFTGEKDIIKCINKISANLDDYSSKIKIKSIADIAQEYISFLESMFKNK